MRFAFLAAEPRHESVAFFAQLLTDRGHSVDLHKDAADLREQVDYDLAWYRFSPGRRKPDPDRAWEALLLLEARGVRTVNSSRSLLVEGDKSVTDVLLADPVVRPPETQRSAA